MFAYLLVIILLLICVYSFDIKGNRKNKHLWEMVVVFVLILVSGLRNHVGSDSMVYEYKFLYETELLKNFFKGKDLLELREPGWELLLSICKTVFGSFVSVQVIHAFLLNSLLYKFFKRTTDKIFTAFLLSFIVFWFEFNFESLRQSLCIAIFINAVFLLLDKKIILYVLLSVIAFSIQNFSIVIFLLAPAFLFFPKRILIPSFLVLVLFSYFFVDESFLNILVLGSENLLNDSMQTKVLSYTQSDTYGFQNSNLNGWIKLIILNFVFPLSVILLNNTIIGRKVNKNRDFSKSTSANVYYVEVFNGLILLYMFLGALSARFVILYRFQFYITPVIIASITVLLYDKKDKSINRLVFLFFFLIFIMDSTITLYKPASSRLNETYDTRYFPYKSVFQAPDPVRERYWGM